MMRYSSLFIYVFFLLSVTFSSAALSVEPTLSPLSLKKLFRPPSVYNAQISSEGRFTAIVLVEGNSKYLVVKASDREVYTTVGKFERLGYLEYSWIDDDTLFYQYKPGVYGERREFVTFSEQGSSISVERTKNRHRGYILDPLPDENDVVIYALRADQFFHNQTIGRNRDYRWGYELFRVHISDLASVKRPKKKFLKKSLKKAIEYYIDPESKYIFGTTVKSDTYTLWAQINKKKWRKVFTYSDEDIYFRPISLVDEDTIVAVTNIGSDTRSVVLFDIRKQKVEETLYRHESYDIADASWDGENKKLRHVEFYEYNQRKSVYFDDVSKANQSLIKNAFNNKQYIVVSQSADRTQQILTVFDSDDPGRYVYFNGPQKVVKELYPHREYLEGIPFKKSEKIVVDSEEGHSIEAILTRPEESRDKHILLVNPHGGPVGVRQKDSFSASTQFFVSHGFSVLNVNFRGSEGYGKDFKNGGVGEFGRAIERDIQAAVEAVRNKYDYRSLCTIGSSYGGYSSLVLAIKYPELYKCVVAMYGVYDLVLLFNSNNYEHDDEHRDWVSKVVGEYDVDALIKHSPLYNLEPLKAPVLIVAGKVDGVADFEHSSRLKFMLEHSGKEHKFVAYDGVAHGQHTYPGDREEHILILEFLKDSLNLK